MAVLLSNGKNSLSQWTCSSVPEIAAILDAIFMVEVPIVIRNLRWLQRLDANWTLDKVEDV